MVRVTDPFWMQYIRSRALASLSRSFSLMMWSLATISWRRACSWWHKSSRSSRAWLRLRSCPLLICCPLVSKSVRHLFPYFHFHSVSHLGCQISLFDSAHLGIMSGFHAAQGELLTQFFQGIFFSRWVLFLGPSLLLSNMGHSWVCGSPNLLLALY